MGLFTSDPPQYDIMKIPGTASMRPPMFGFAKDFGEYLRSLIGQAAPQYQGSIDPGMSPSMQALGVLSQMYANSPMPAVFGQAHASMGRFNNPSFTNATARMQYGAPDYFGSQYGPDQFLPGGSKLGAIPYAGGMRPYANFTPGSPWSAGSGQLPPPAMPQGPSSANIPELLKMFMGNRTGAGAMQPTIPNEGGQIGPMGRQMPPGGMSDQDPWKYGAMQRQVAY